MNQLAPEPVDVATCLGAAREQRLTRHRGVFDPVAGGHVGVTPVDIQDLVVRISMGLTTRTIRARDNRRVGEEVRHLTMASFISAIDSTLAARRHRERKNQSSSRTMRAPSTSARSFCWHTQRGVSQKPQSGLTHRRCASM